MATRATRHYPTSKGWTPAAIGVTQAGGIRASINTKTNSNHNGSIPLEDIMTVIPWGDKVLILNMTGSVLLEALEHSVARYEDTITGHVSEFLQVSGKFSTVQTPSSEKNNTLHSKAFSDE
ncbi:hypothetical protein J6590_000055 [Homalodisca vitripennis]|nr:hypothetical protein J6590_000055 [Homalodisca vitripennis]